MTEQQLLEQAPCDRPYAHHRHVWTDHVNGHLGNDFQCSGDPAPRSGIKEYLVVAALLVDPDRWADSDLQRDGWLLVAKYYAIAAVIITALVIGVGVALR